MGLDASYLGKQQKAHARGEVAAGGAWQGTGEGGAGLSLRKPLLSAPLPPFLSPAGRPSSSALCWGAQTSCLPPPGDAIVFRHMANPGQSPPLFRDRASLGTRQSALAPLRGEVCGLLQRLRSLPPSPMPACFPLPPCSPSYRWGKQRRRRRRRRCGGASGEGQVSGLSLLFSAGWFLDKATSSLAQHVDEEDVPQLRKRGRAGAPPFPPSG